MSLLLLAARPAQAQYGYGSWNPQPCDSGGNPLSYAPTDNSGYYIMRGTQSGQAANTYPTPMIAAAIANPSSYGQYLDAAAPLGPSPVVFSNVYTASANGNNNSIGTDYPACMYAQATNSYNSYNGFYSVPASFGSPSSGPINGSVSVNLSGQLVYYFKEQWSGYGTPTAPMPSHINLLLKTTLSAQASVNYGTATQTSGLSAQSTAMDGPPFNELASASAGDAGPSPGPGSVVGYHLVRSPVDPATGIAEVYLNGTAIYQASNSVAWGQSVPPYGYPQQTNGYTWTNASASVAGGLAQTSAGLEGHSTVDTSAPGNPWDPTNPRFFSGTNCSATATAPAINGYVSQAHLLIGGIAVKDYYDTNFVGPIQPGAATGTNQSSVSLTAYFDSTHFADGSNIPIQMSVTDTNGNTYDGNISASAYNKAYDLGNDALDGGQLDYGRIASNNASAQFNAMQHTVTRSTTDGKGAILGNLPTYTAFYTWTHGLDLPSVFGDCFAHDVSPPANYLYANASDDTTGAMSVTQAVAAKTVAMPPYNFAFCDACLTAQNGGMAGAFGVTTSSADQAYLGFTTESDDSQHNADWSNRFLTDLSSGLSAGASQTDANNNIGFPILEGEHATTYIWGDNGAKLHGVYGGTGTQWFK